MKLSGILAATLLLGSSMSGPEIPSGGRIPTSKRRDPHPIDEEIINPFPLKGQKKEKIKIKIEHNDKIFIIYCCINYGTEKSRIKQFKSLQGYLGRYILNTPLSLLVQYNQFKIEDK